MFYPMINQFTNYLMLMRLARPIGIYLLLWSTLWGLWFAADGFPSLRILLIFITGVVLMRSAGCVINDYADRKIDPLVARTKNRPIASGRVSPTEAMVVFIVLLILAFLLVLQTNTLTVYMSAVALFLAVSYPFMKRIHSLPQAHLGLAFGWAIPMAYTAQSNALPPLEGWLLYAASVCWSVAYDTMYAMADRDDDQAIGVKSSALLFGDYDRLMIGIFQLSALVLLFSAGYLKGLSWFYYGGLVVAAALATYQQYLISARQPELCLRAFNNNNYFGMAVFVGLLVSLLF